MRSVNFSLLIALASSALASDGSKPLSLSIESKRSTAEAESSIRVSVSMALVPVSVTDTIGRNVTGLQRENFRVLDDKQPRDIASFSRKTNRLRLDWFSTAAAACPINSWWHVRLRHNFTGSSTTAMRAFS